MNSKYEKIINLERPKSERHPKMGRLKRAAQFRPCLMQSGYEEEVESEANGGSEVNNMPVAY